MGCDWFGEGGGMGGGSISTQKALVHSQFVYMLWGSTPIFIRQKAVYEIGTNFHNLRLGPSLSFFRSTFLAFIISFLFACMFACFPFV